MCALAASITANAACSPSASARRASASVNAPRNAASTNTRISTLFAASLRTNNPYPPRSPRATRCPFGWARLKSYAECITDNRWAAFSQTYTVDALDRLVDATVFGAANPREQFGMDRLGNFTSTLFDANANGTLTDAGDLNDCRTHTQSNEIAARDLACNVSIGYRRVSTLLSASFNRCSLAHSRQRWVSPRRAMSSSRAGVRSSVRPARSCRRARPSVAWRWLG